MSGEGLKTKNALALKGAYAGLNALYWMLYCVASGFAGVFLLDRGYSNSQVGVILALGYVLCLVLQPAIASAADRAKTPVRVMAAMGGAIALALAVLVVTPGQSWFVAGVYVLLLALAGAFQPLVNAYAFYIERLDVAVPFGLCRSMGSLGYAVISAALGVITVCAGVGSIPVSGLVVIGGMLALMAWFSRYRAPALPERENAARRGDGLKSPSFILFLAGTALIFISHAFFNNFTFQIVQRAGGDSGDMGVLAAYVAVLELPGMLLFDRLHKKFSCQGMLRVAAVFFAVKCLLVMAAGSLPGLYGALFFQALCYPLFIPGSVRYAGELAGPERANRAQAAVTAMITVGNVCASAGGGVVIDALGMTAALGVASVFACAGVLVTFIGLREGT